jgi:hypothetical protein
MENFTDWPCFTEAEVGTAETEKSAPIPLRPTLGLAEVIPSVPETLRRPRRVPRAVGLNVTANEHEAPPGRPSAEQVFVWEKSPVIPIPENWKQIAPVLLRVTDCGLLDVPGPVQGT